jgi:hypothetical protein
MIIKLNVRLNNHRYEILYYQDFVDFAQYFSLFRSFNIPCIAEDRLHQNIDKLAVAILSKLKRHRQSWTLIMIVGDYNFMERESKVKTKDVV